MPLMSLYIYIYRGLNKGQDIQMVLSSVVAKYREVKTQMKCPCIEDLRYEMNIAKAARSIWPQYKDMKIIQQILYIINQPTLNNS